MKSSWCLEFHTIYLSIVNSWKESFIGMFTFISLYSVSRATCEKCRYWPKYLSLRRGNLPRKTRRILLLWGIGERMEDSQNEKLSMYKNTFHIYTYIYVLSQSGRGGRKSSFILCHFRGSICRNHGTAAWLLEMRYSWFFWDPLSWSFFRARFLLAPFP